VLDTALTIVTRRGDYEFDPPLESEPQDEIMAYAISAIGRRGSGGWVAWESGGERIMHPVAPDDPYFDRLAEWFTALSRELNLAPRYLEVLVRAQAAVAARHVRSASSRRTRSVRREVRWRWTLNVLWTAA
jgi:hypothetical protein